ncbi:hypothetical protein [Bradyrhizobium canariense]|uniref:Uncharacterized protein n=1 Tax=Bradyrhizobium canariense TaxID=255045 RepID=A0A1X3H1D9_9BRAD|nr:hypothetical protein [Bradyrhizobium canariense]OSI66358.1 hypothetical protein BSZ22_27955 [Bradyrhizobium canariense]OSI77746.1 hypothetical protein BSZ23_20745 [Bradyrhizobium canariense]OSI86717.1 hypothetical protein BSZ24_28635 [Bradyrhizobium canariense]OSI88904.1 hypothetical protein BSZ25_22215 [Bradyrhizobium canariense]OSJ01358.1 hypothetical protein BSZ16_19635 [Bradyrhizobium canariense]
MSEFKITTSWSPTGGRNEVDLTFCNLMIEVGNKVVTEFLDGRDNVVPQLQIPAYYLAEWMAENWWALLWEPRKNEDEIPQSASPTFNARHSLLSAQHGFALPRLLFLPQDRSVYISSSGRDVELAGVRFRNTASTALKRELVEEVLRDFVAKVVARLEAGSIKGTFLQDAWSQVIETDEEEAQFCRCAGALGLSPYDIDDWIADLIERLQPVLGDRLLMDLCLSSTLQTFESAATLAEEAALLTKNAATSTLSPLETVRLPADNLSVQAYRRGVQAADLVRRRLGIKDTDPGAATKVFDTLHVDTTVRGEPRRRSDEEISITGAVVREDSDMRVALLQETQPKRRFAAARAVFSGWSAEPHESRLLTSAVTRDQQANRAFAAELTAPKALLRKRASKNFLSQSAVYELADELMIGPDVVAKNAENNGIETAWPRSGL